MAEGGGVQRACVRGLGASVDDLGVRVDGWGSLMHGRSPDSKSEKMAKL